MESAFPPAATCTGLTDDGDAVATPQWQLVWLQCQVVIQSVAVAKHTCLVIHSGTCTTNLTPGHYCLVLQQVPQQPQLSVKSKVKVKDREICTAPHRKKLTSEALRYGWHSFYTANTPCLPSPRKRSLDGTPSTSNSSHLITAYYSFINPRRMKDWVGLVSWPTADGLPI